MMYENNIYCTESANYRTRCFYS